MFEEDNTLKHNRKRRTTQINLHIKEKQRRASDAKCLRILFPVDTCINCDKKQKRLRRYTRYEQLVKLVKSLRSDAEIPIKQAATQAQKIEVIGRIYLNLRAREAYYYESCQHNFVVKAR